MTFEQWLTKHYDMQGQQIFGNVMTWEQACESDDLFYLYEISEGEKNEPMG